MFQVHAIPAFSDNYIWCIQDENGDALVVDPGCAKSVNTFLDNRQLNLKAILITHHHPDHIGGVNTLKETHKATVYGYRDSNLSFLDQLFIDKDSFTVIGIRFSVIEVPGHTLDHIAFYTETPLTLILSEGQNNEEQLLQPSLFCGDTLFSGGCGRLFEGTAEQMFHSLEKIAMLPEETSVFCAHEYTLSNLKFAQSVMPENQQLHNYLKACQFKREKSRPTIPSTLKVEHDINPFLRSRDPELIANLRATKRLKDETPLEVFRATRQAKDSF